MKTKKERNDIYKKALLSIESRNKEFICNAIESIYNYNPTVICNKNTFPELFIFRDDKSNNAWVSQEGTDDEYLSSTEKGNFIREIILDFCIELSN